MNFWKMFPLKLSQISTMYGCSRDTQRLSSEALWETFTSNMNAALVFAHKTKERNSNIFQASVLINGQQFQLNVRFKYWVITQEILAYVWRILELQWVTGDKWVNRLIARLWAKRGKEWFDLPRCRPTFVWLVLDLFCWAFPSNNWYLRVRHVYQNYKIWDLTWMNSINSGRRVSEVGRSLSAKHNEVCTVTAYSEDSNETVSNIH